MFCLRPNNKPIKDFTEKIPPPSDELIDDTGQKLPRRKSPHPSTDREILGHIKNENQGGRLMTIGASEDNIIAYAVDKEGILTWRYAIVTYSNPRGDQNPGEFTLTDMENPDLSITAPPKDLMNGGIFFRYLDEEERKFFNKPKPDGLSWGIFIK